MQDFVTSKGKNDEFCLQGTIPAVRGEDWGAAGAPTVPIPDVPSSSPSSQLPTAPGGGIALSKRVRKVSLFYQCPISWGRFKEQGLAPLAQPEDKKDSPLLKHLWRQRVWALINTAIITPMALAAEREIRGTAALLSPFPRALVTSQSSWESLPSSSQLLERFSSFCFPSCVCAAPLEESGLCLWLLEAGQELSVTAGATGTPRGTQSSQEWTQPCPGGTGAAGRGILMFPG